MMQLFLPRNQRHCIERKSVCARSLRDTKKFFKRTDIDKDGRLSMGELASTLFEGKEVNITEVLELHSLRLELLKAAAEEERKAALGDEDDEEDSSDEEEAVAPEEKEKDEEAKRAALVERDLKQIQKDVGFLISVMLYFGTSVMQYFVTSVMHQILVLRSYLCYALLFSDCDFVSYVHALVAMYVCMYVYVCVCLCVCVCVCVCECVCVCGV
jgi:hypothetical protein